MPSSVLRRLALLGLAGLGAACASPREDAIDHVEGEAPIVGDDRADGEQPSVVRLAISQDGLAYTCTGTLLGSRTVITARHCLEKRLGPGGSCDVKVFLDRTGVGTTDARTEQYTASLCEIREPDKSLSASRDVATIRLGTKVPSPPVATIAEPWETNDDYDVYGYGSWGEPPFVGVTCSNHSNGHKRKAHYRGRLGFRLGQTTCPGDSGGPHFIAGTSKLAGITSTGYAVWVAYEMNTELGPHIAWVRDRLRTYEAP